MSYKTKCKEQKALIVELKTRLKDNYEAYQRLKKAFEKVSGAYCYTLQIEY